MSSCPQGAPIAPSVEVGRASGRSGTGILTDGRRPALSHAGGASATIALRAGTSAQRARSFHYLASPPSTRAIGEHVCQEAVPQRVDGPDDNSHWDVPLDKAPLSPGCGGCVSRPRPKRYDSWQITLWVRRAWWKYSPVSSEM